LSSTHEHSIIIIDDEVELATLFKEFLEMEGYDVLSFTDPLIALEYIKETSNNHSLIITDLRMPGLCGITLAKNVRRINKDITIFLMTAFDSSDLLENKDFKEAKIDRILQKPIQFSDLRKMIKKVLIK
jgi:DNA-binding response OmpR family regulator